MKSSLKIAAAVLAVVGSACLVVYFYRGAGKGKLTWQDPVVKKSVMTFAYKIYGDSSVEDGRFFLSKLVFHNDGTGPVHNLSVSYQIPDYISWTTPQSYPEILAGQTIVELYYPHLPSRVTELANQTNATLETKIHWSDRRGEEEQVLRSDVILHGVNEMEYTDLPASEIADWYDSWANTPLLVAMVTPNDPVVKEFVAEITRRTGGTMVGVLNDTKTTATFMKAIYDYMCETGMRYTGDEGVPATLGDVTTAVQTVRLPRDVIITNEGLCVELALLWASIMEHLGCQATLLFRPGHAFTIVSTTDKPYLIPIECTAITPMAVDANEPVPFEKAVEMAWQDLQKQQYKMPINIAEYRKQGFRAPELPHVDVEKIKSILAQRTAHTATAYAENAGSAAQGSNTNNQAPKGYYRWIGADNSASVDVPESWTRAENGLMLGMVFMAQDAHTSVAVNIFHYPDLTSAAEGMEKARKGFAKSGGKVRIASQQQKGSSIVYTGTTSSQKGSTQWVGLFGPTQRGVVGFFVGAAQGHFTKNQPIIQDVISSARISTGDGAQ
jgi:hypothetical protein